MGSIREDLTYCSGRMNPLLQLADSDLEADTKKPPSSVKIKLKPTRVMKSDFVTNQKGERLSQNESYLAEPKSSALTFKNLHTVKRETFVEVNSFSKTHPPFTDNLSTNSYSNFNNTNRVISSNSAKCRSK